MIETLKLLLSGIAVAVSLASFAYAWHSARNRAQRAEIEALKERIASVDGRRATNVGELRDRITRVEEKLPHLPDQKSMHELSLRIEEMHGDMKALQQALKGVQGQLETANDFLLRERKG